jgi:hypothetical protein
MQPVAVRATPIAALDRPVVVRVVAASVALGLLMSFVGAFRLQDDPPVLRTVWIVAASLIGAALNLAGYQAALAVPGARKRFWSRVAVAAAIVALPIAVLVWATLWSLGGRPGPAGLLIGFLNAFVVGGAFIAAVVAPVMDAAVRRAGAEPMAPQSAGAPAGFADRLPLRLRGGELWALQAEDHYVRVHTSRGEALLRLRMADALRELRGVDGAQTHRSWWVARAAVRDVKRDGGRVALVLPDGKEAAVSRGLAADLRAAGWF